MIAELAKGRLTKAKITRHACGDRREIKEMRKVRGGI